MISVFSWIIESSWIWIWIWAALSDDLDGNSRLTWNHLISWLDLHHCIQCLKLFDFSPQAVQRRKVVNRGWSLADTQGHGFGIGWAGLWILPTALYHTSLQLLLKHQHNYAEESNNVTCLRRSSSSDSPAPRTILNPDSFSTEQRTMCQNKGLCQKQRTMPNMHTCIHTPTDYRHIYIHTYIRPMSRILPCRVLQCEVMSKQLKNLRC